MSANRKLIRNIVIAVIGLAVLVGAYVLAVKWEPDKKDDDDIMSKTTDITYVVSENVDDVKTISIKNSKEEYSIEKISSGDTIVYTIPAVKSGDADEAELRNAFKAFSQIMAERVVTEDVTRSEEYGINAGSISVTLSKNNGDKIKIYFGSKTPTAEEYYCMVENGNKIFTVKSAIYSMVERTINDYRITKVLNIEDISNISGLSLYKNNEQILHIRHTTQEENSGKIMASGWTMEYPWLTELANDKTAEMLQKLAVIKATGFAADDKSISFEYRLDIACGEEKYSFDIGQSAGEAYLKNNNSNIIYTADVGLFSVLNSINPNDYISKFVNLYDITKVVKLTVKTNSKEYTMEPGTENTPYKICGTEVEESAFKKDYQTIIGLCFTEITDLSPSGEHIMTISFEFNDGTKQEINFYELNEREYLAVRLNEYSVKVLKSDLEKILSLTENR